MRVVIPVGKFKIGDFFAKKCQKIVIFCQKSSFFEGFSLITSILSLVLAENFLKSSTKCLLACASSGIRGKIQNWGFFGQKVSKIAIFAKNPVF